VPGEPVVFLRNDYRRGLPNGSLGEIAAADGGLITAIFDGIGHRFAGRELDDLDHAYAITIHKAQGSGFDAVVVPVVPSRLLDRALVYTAVTRGIERVVMIGIRANLQEAVDRLPASEYRRTGLIAAFKPQAIG
jgi:exodeoxyribonuclease V alpha subunit